MEQLTEQQFQSREVSLFLSPKLTAEIDVREDTEGWPYLLIGEDEVSLVDTPVDAMLVQPGHVQKDPKLKDLRGKFMLKGYEDEGVDELHVLPITIMNHGFRKYAGDYNSADSGQKLLCFSNNSPYPSDKVVGPMNQVCYEIAQGRGGVPIRKVVCPYAQWGENNQKPQCMEQIRVAFFDLDRGTPIAFQFHGTGMGAWNSMLRNYRQMRNIAKLKKRSIFDYYCRITADDKGTYVVPKFDIVSSSENLGKYIPLLLYYKQVFTFMPLEEEKSGPKETDIEIPPAAQSDVSEVTENLAF